MKKLFTVLSLSILLSGCTTYNGRGACIGVLDKPEPNKAYEICWWNCFVGFVFCETIIVPIIVACKQYQCPVE